MLKPPKVNRIHFLLSMIILSLLPLAAGADTGLVPKLAAVREQLANYRKASARAQATAADLKIPYCVFNEYDPSKKDKTRVGWQTVDGVRKFISQSPFLDTLAADAAGVMSKHQGVPVKATLFNIFQGLVPLDTDTYRVLRQTREYDRQNLEKFELFAGGFEKVEPEAAQGRAREQLRRLAGKFAFGGLDQLVEYVQRDFGREFNGKRMMNFGSCDGVADRVLETANQLRAERAALGEIVRLLGELAQDE